MPLSTIIMLAGVVAVFALLAGVLAWAQLHTRHLGAAPIAAGATNRPKKRAF